MCAFILFLFSPEGKQVCTNLFTFSLLLISICSVVRFLNGVSTQLKANEYPTFPQTVLCCFIFVSLIQHLQSTCSVPGPGLGGRGSLLNKTIRAPLMSVQSWTIFLFFALFSFILAFFSLSLSLPLRFLLLFFPSFSYFSSILSLEIIKGLPF